MHRPASPGPLTSWPPSRTPWRGGPTWRLLRRRMALLPERNRTTDLALLVFGAGALILVSPARNLWAAGRSWFIPFVLWLALIAAVAWIGRRRRSRDA